MALQMGPRGSITLSREEMRSVSFQVGGRRHLRDLTKNRGEENRQNSWETQPGGCHPAVRAGWKGRGCACEQPVRLRVPGTHLLIQPQESPLKGSSALCQAAVPCGMGSSSRAAGRGWTTLCICLGLWCLCVLTTATNLWKCSSHSIT